MKRIASLAAAVTIPLSSSTGWQELKFKKIPANGVTYSEAGLLVEVKKSSSPLIYRLETPLRVTGFAAKVKVTGAMNSTSTPFPEDAYLRLGLVAPGQRKMSRFERMMAPEWLKKLFSLAPEGTGIDRVYFFNLVDRGAGKSREFPGSKGMMSETLLRERKPTESVLELTHRLEKPLNVLALWLSIDGDDSQSSYTLTLEKLILEGEAASTPRLEKSE